MGGKDLRCGMGEHPYHMWHVSHLCMLEPLRLLPLTKSDRRCSSVYAFNVEIEVVYAPWWQFRRSTAGFQLIFLL